jgi:hypothetical protein
MTNVISYAVRTYSKHLELITLSSLSFVISFIIPAFAQFPTFNDLGSIFVRTASMYYNLDIQSTIIIIAATMFSLLFLSFAIVAMAVVVKHSRTSTRITKEVLDGLESYTGKVFTILLLFTGVLMIADIALYGTGYAGIFTAVLGLILTPFFIFAPSSVVIDESSAIRAIKRSARFFAKRFDYFLLWLAIAIILLTLVDGIAIGVSGTLVSRYAVLVVDSIFVLPFLTILINEMYMKRFALLKI